MKKILTIFFLFLCWNLFAHNSIQGEVLGKTFYLNMEKPDFSPYQKAKEIPNFIITDHSDHYHIEGYDGKDPILSRAVLNEENKTVSFPNIGKDLPSDKKSLNYLFLRKLSEVSSYEMEGKTLYLLNDKKERILSFFLKS